MEKFIASSFGDGIADIYDDFYDEQTRPQAAKVQMLSSLADSGDVLDIGCGTGRMAEALSRRGINVVGLDVSSRMLEQAKTRVAASGSLKWILGDIAEPQAKLGGPFRLAYLLFETLIMVGNLERQRSAISNVVESLETRGKVLFEFTLMEFGRPTPFADGGIRVSRISADEVVLGASKFNRDEGRLDFQDIRISEDGVKLMPLVMHPISLSQLDSMCQHEGLRRVSVYRDWSGAKLRRDDYSVIAVYEKI